MKTKPRKLEFGQYAFGRHFDIWCYDAVPDGMRQAQTSDIIIGRMILYKVHIGPDAGCYYTGMVTADNQWIFIRNIDDHWPVYVKD